MAADQNFDLEVLRERSLGPQRRRRYESEYKSRINIDSASLAPAEKLRHLQAERLIHLQAERDLEAEKWRLKQEHNQKGGSNRRKRTRRNKQRKTNKRYIRGRRS